MAVRLTKPAQVLKVTRPPASQFGMDNHQMPVRSARQVGVTARSRSQGARAVTGTRSK